MHSTHSRILTINGGSSSIKFALFDVGESFQPILEGKIVRITLPDSTLHLKTFDPLNISTKLIKAPDYRAAIEALMRFFEEQKESIQFNAVGHRIVHGGWKYSKAQRITEELLNDLRFLKTFDPEHLPGELLLVEMFKQSFPNVPQVACFDTAFHSDLPQVAKILPIPRRFEEQGVRKYGFHGLSCAFLMEELTRLEGFEAAQGRVILAHLGNGASLTAVHQGKSVDTSMSFTPSSGIPMSTRSGDLDPGLIEYFAQVEKYDAKRIYEMLNSQSGLLGVSETHSDMQDLLKIEHEDIRAAEAINMFCYQVKKWIGAFTTILGGLDTLVFAGGIGENASKVRLKICRGLEFLGIELDLKENQSNASLISLQNSPVTVRVIHTDEEKMIALTVDKVLRNRTNDSIS